MPRTLLEGCVYSPALVCRPLGLMYAHTYPNKADPSFQPAPYLASPTCLPPWDFFKSYSQPLQSANTRDWERLNPAPKGTNWKCILKKKKELQKRRGNNDTVILHGLPFTLPAPPR